MVHCGAAMAHCGAAMAHCGADRFILVRLLYRFYKKALKINWLFVGSFFAL